MALPTRARLRAKQFLLTYPHCAVDVVEIERQLTEITMQQEKLITYICICQEKHKDNFLHAHVILILNEKIDTRNMLIFDIKDGNNQIYHPNIKTIQTNIERAIAYVKKGNNWIERGTNPIEKMKIKKEEKMRFIREHTIDEILQSNNFSLFEVRTAIQLRQTLENRTRNWPIFRKRDVHWFWGPTGSGKTRKAIQIMEEKHTNNWKIISNDMRTFIIGYEGEKGIIIDDIRKGTCKFEHLLHLLDGYPIMVNVKGGQREWLAETIIITCPMKPDVLFVNQETLEPWDHIDQLLRRIEDIREFPEALEQTPTQILEPPTDEQVPKLPEAPSEVLSPNPQLPSVELDQ